MARLLNPATTAAVVLGAHDWSQAALGRAPSFRRSARRITAYLYDPAGLGLDPELVLDLFDDSAGAGEQLARVRDTLDEIIRDRRQEGRAVTDILVYYVGHGVTDDQNHLALLVKQSRQGLETETGIKALDLASVLRRAAPQQRRTIILDCCFSEAALRAFAGMSADLSKQVAAIAAGDLEDGNPERGVILFCSSSSSKPSIGAPDAERTLFTGAVLEVLSQGVKKETSHISFAELRDAVYDRMLASYGANAPRPALHQVNAAYGDLTRTPAFPNPAADRFRREAQRQAEVRKGEEERQRLAQEAEAEAQRQAEVRKGEEERQRLAQRAEAEAQRQAEVRKGEEERQRLAREAEAEALRQAEARKGEEERQRLAQEAPAELRRQAEAHKVERERQKQAREAEGEVQRQAEARAADEERQLLARETEAELRQQVEARKAKEEQQRLAEETLEPSFYQWIIKYLTEKPIPANWIRVTIVALVSIMFLLLSR